VFLPVCMHYVNNSAVIFLAYIPNNIVANRREMVPSNTPTSRTCLLNGRPASART